MGETMTLQDAIGLDLPFRRKAWTHAAWMIADRRPSWSGAEPYGGGRLIWEGTGQPASISYLNDLFAKDYEVRKKQEAETCPY